MDLLTTTSTQPERAWQMVLGQLQMEMSKASFDTWVKSIEFISLIDDRYTLGTYNAYGRDWLDSRLKTTVQRLLQGILGRPIAVQFIVLDEVDDQDNDEEEEEQNDHEGEKEEFHLQVLHETVRGVLIEPERVVKLPVYFLRWLPYVDAEILFLVLALRQEHYIQTGGKGNSSGKVAARAERVCQWAGISRAQFFRLMQPDNGFGWFGKKSETDYEVDKRTGKVKKSPNKYTLYGIPITPGDADDLKNFLLENGIQENPKSALLSALSAQPCNILKYPARLPVEGSIPPPRKLTVQDVVREAAGQKLTPDLMDLADQLSDHLLTTNEFILVSWYFLHYWLPLLGADAAMLIFILRNACYFNETTGEMRDEVWIEGGYDALAQRLGLENPRLISHWFPAAIERSRQKETLTQSTRKEVDRRALYQDRMGAFAQRIDHRTGENGNYSWKFKVKRSDPLIPEHELLYRQVARLISDLDHDDHLDELMDWVDKVTNDCSETVKTCSMIVLRRSKFLNDCSETLRTRLNDCFETLKIDSEDCFETLLKILKGFKDSFFEKDSSPNQDSLPSVRARRLSQVAVEVTNSENLWNLDTILSKASEKQRSLLQKQERNAIPFVSWLIHGVSNPQIQNPYSLAIAKLAEAPRKGAGGACERIAAYPPERLIGLIQQRFSLSRPSNKDWELALGNTSLDRVRLLADLLNIPLDLLEVDLDT